MQKSAENGRKSAETWPEGLVWSISNSGQKFFYVTKPKIDDFIPKLRPPPQKKNTPFFWGGGRP